MGNTPSQHNDPLLKKIQTQSQININQRLQTPSNYPYVRPPNDKRSYGPVIRNTAFPTLISRFHEAITTCHEAFESSVVNNGSKKLYGTRSINEYGQFGEYIWETYDQINQRKKWFSAGLASIGLGSIKTSSINAVESISQSLSQNLSVGTIDESPKSIPTVPSQLSNPPFTKPSLLSSSSTHIPLQAPPKSARIGHRLGIMLDNCSEYKVATLACSSSSLIIVPLYTTSSASRLIFIINHADISTIVIQSKYVDIIFQIKTECPCLQKIIVVGPLVTTLADRFKSIGIVKYSWEEIETLGKLEPESSPNYPTSSTICSIIYTSGTTGVPKGVIYTHSNILAGIAGWAPMLQFNTTDTYYSYLPLAHSFEFCVNNFCTFSGVPIGFCSNTTTNIIQDLQILKPTVLCGVPRIFNRIFESVQENLGKKSFMIKNLILTSINQKATALIHGKSSPLLDALFFSKIRKQFGGQLRMVISGSAPLSPHVHSFLRACICDCVLQGWGMTETCSAGTVMSPLDFSIGTVGPPSPCNEIRLRDVPEFGYSSSNVPPQGEICIRGHNVFCGYYRDPQFTRMSFSPDGWFYTGDVGEIAPNGALRIISRTKSIFKLSHGQYVVPLKVEGVLSYSRFVESVFVHGDSEQSTTVAVVVPSKPILSHMYPESSLDQLVKSPQISEMILNDFISICSAAQLPHWEIPSAIHLESQPWTLEDEFCILTPKHSLRRHLAVKRYRKEINQLYEQIKLKKNESFNERRATLD